MSSHFVAGAWFNWCKLAFVSLLYFEYNRPINRYFCWRGVLALRYLRQIQVWFVKLLLQWESCFLVRSLLPSLNHYMRCSMFSVLRSWLRVIELNLQEVNYTCHLKERLPKMGKITGHPKKSVSRTVHLFFAWLYRCFIQTWCMNNDWKCDFWHPRCLF